MPEPIVPLRLFKDSTFSLFLIVSLMTGGVAIGMVNYFALFLQTTHGLSPTQAGLFFIAVTAASIGSLTAGRLISITGRYKPFVVTGLVMNVITLLLFSQLHAGSSLVLVGFIMLLQAFPSGLANRGRSSACRTPRHVPMSVRPRARSHSHAWAVPPSPFRFMARSLPPPCTVFPFRAWKMPAAISPDQMAKLPEATRLAVANAYAVRLNPCS